MQAAVLAASEGKQAVPAAGIWPGPSLPPVERSTLEQARGTAASGVDGPVVGAEAGTDVDAAVTFPGEGRTAPDGTLTRER